MMQDWLVALAVFAIVIVVFTWAAFLLAVFGHGIF